MAILDRTIVNLNSNASNAVSTEVSNSDVAPRVGLIFTDLVDVNNNATGVAFGIAAVGGIPGQNTSNAAGLGVTLTDREINTAGWFSNVLGANTYEVTLTFPAGQGDVDIDVYNALDNFTGQDTMTVNAVGLSTVSQTLGIADGIGSNSDGSFFELSGVTPAADNTIRLELVNTGGASFFNLNGVVISPTVTGASLTLPTATATTTTITPSATTDDSTGTMYSVLVPSGDTTPSTAQVIAGQDSSGASTTNSNSTVTASPHTLPALTGLSPNTAYDVYIVQTTTSGNSNIATLSVTTDIAITSGNIDLVNESTAIVPNTQFDWFISSAWGSPVLASGQTTTDPQGNLAITGLTIAAGNYFIHLRMSSSITNLSGSDFTVV